MEPKITAILCSSSDPVRSIAFRLKALCRTKAHFSSIDFGFVCEAYALAFLIKSQRLCFVSHQLNVDGVTVDLVMAKKSEIFFFEVKSASTGFFYARRVTSSQQKRLAHAARYFMRCSAKRVTNYEIRVVWGEIPVVLPLGRA